MIGLPILDLILLRNSFIVKSSILLGLMVHNALKMYILAYVP